MRNAQAPGRYFAFFWRIERQLSFDPLNRESIKTN